MKNIIFLIFLLCALNSCDKTTEKNAVLTKDCTGSYISHTFNNVDYLICNDELVANIENGTEISVTYKTVKACNNSNQTICELYHKNEGIIELIKIK